MDTSDNSDSDNIETTIPVDETAETVELTGNGLDNNENDDEIVSEIKELDDLFPPPPSTFPPHHTELRDTSARRTPIDRVFGRPLSMIPSTALHEQDSDEEDDVSPAPENNTASSPNSLQPAAPASNPVRNPASIPTFQFQPAPAPENNTANNPVRSPNTFQPAPVHENNTASSPNSLQPAAPANNPVSKSAIKSASTPTFQFQPAPAPENNTANNPVRSPNTFQPVKERKPAKELKNPITSRYSPTDPTYTKGGIITKRRELRQTSTQLPSLDQATTNFESQTPEESSQKHISQNNPFINSMPLPHTVTENRDCPDGNCTVNRQVTKPQFGTFQPHTNSSTSDIPNFSLNLGANPNQQGTVTSLPSDPDLPPSQPDSVHSSQIPPPPPLNLGASAAQQNNAGTGTASAAQQNNTTTQLPQFNAGGMFNRTGYPPLPTTATQHHQTNQTQFDQYAKQAPANLFKNPVNQPPTGQFGGLARPPLPQFNQQGTNSNAGDIIRPPQRSSKTAIPALLWDGQSIVTNKRSLTFTNNKNILSHIGEIPNDEIDRIFKYLKKIPVQDRSFRRYVVGQNKITLAYILPTREYVRKAWYNQLMTDPTFRNDVEAYNQKQKQTLAEMSNLSVQQVDEDIKYMLAAYESNNTDRVSKPSNKSVAAFRRVNGVLVDNQQFNNQQFSNQQFNNQQFNNQQFSNQQFNNQQFNNQQSPCVYYNTPKDCMDTAEPIRGYRRMMRSQNPCVIDYIEIKNKNDLQNSMIGCTVNNPINNDPDCAVKYNMIKTFLDENGYHLEKNSTRKSRSRKN